jgi:hypothetical protein
MSVCSFGYDGRCRHRSKSGEKNRMRATGKEALSEETGEIDILGKVISPPIKFTLRSRGDRH